MGYNILERKLAKIVGAKNVKQAEPLKDHCAYGIGGNAKYFVCPPDFVSLIKVLNLAKTQKVKCKIIGNGTNLLFADEGYDGIIICTKQISSYQLVDKSSILVTSGTTIGALLNICQSNGLSGLEFMAGIPGTVGGAVIMNAGAFGGEIAERIKMVGYFENGELKKRNTGYMEKEELKSRLPDNIRWSSCEEKEKRTDGNIADIMLRMISFSCPWNFIRERLNAKFSTINPIKTGKMYCVTTL